MTPSLRIRQATAADAVALARLSGQLGYHACADAAARRLHEIEAHHAGVVLVAAADDGTIAGFAHVLSEYCVVDEPKGYLAELVVEESFRGEGIGAALLRSAEDWAREHGFCAMRLNSNVIRARAHRFYLREGYVEKKRQAVFVKPLEGR